MSARKHLGIDELELTKRAFLQIHQILHGAETLESAIASSFLTFALITHLLNMVHAARANQDRVSVLALHQAMVGHPA